MAPLPSQRSPEPWEITVDMSHRELLEARRISKPVDQLGSDQLYRAFDEELTHLIDFGITDPERLAAELGLPLDTFEKRLERMSTHDHGKYECLSRSLPFSFFS